MSDVETITHTGEKLKAPSMWRVVLHNDDFTPFDFVIELLMVVFHKSLEEANLLAQTVHTCGKAIVNTYTKEIALTKVDLSTSLAEEHGHPLKITAEEA